MSEYRTIPTTCEVWHAIQTAHPDMVVFSCHTDMDGERTPDRGQAFTAWGFGGHAFPVMEAFSTWEINREHPAERINEQHQYWLCCGEKTDE